MWIWIKDLGSVSAEDWSLQWDLEHIHFLLTLTGSGVCKSCIGSLCSPRKGGGHIMLPGAPDGRSAFPEESLSLEHKKLTLPQWHSWEDVICLSFLNSRRNFSWQKLSLPPRGSGDLFVCCLGHLLKVWQGLKALEAKEGWRLRTFSTIPTGAGFSPLYPVA